MIMSDCRYSNHLTTRAAQRGLSLTQIDYVMTHGQVVIRAGGIWYILRRQDLPFSHHRIDTWAKLAGIIVLASSDGHIITVYRNPKPCRHIAKKQKYNRERTHKVA